MTDVLVLGAGYVVGPLVRELLCGDDLRVTLATRTVARARLLLEGLPRATAVALDVADRAALEGLVRESRLVVSMLPYAHHLDVARLAIAHRKPMVTTSYVSPEMAALDEPARRAGIAIVNELGLDPGIDHMSAARIIHGVKRAGGRVLGFTSWCGALPAPEAADNPFGYKCSWSPRGVVLAARNPARFLRDGVVVECPAARLFDEAATVDVAGAGRFEGYPNRDSLAYLPRYEIDGAHTMLRGTLRHPGWCAVWAVIARAGWLDDAPAGVGGRPFREVFGTRAALAGRLGIPASTLALDALEWLGVFAERPVPPGTPSVLDALSGQLEARLTYRAGERDLVVMRHDFVVERGGRRSARTATLVQFGEAGRETAVARTVGLPAALGARALLRGAIPAAGVLTPVSPEVYAPILGELERRGLAFVESERPLDPAAG